MADPVLPSGTVTFLFTDVEGSTRLWEEHPEAMRPALAEHDELIRGAVEAHGGHVVKTTGDGVHAAFATADDGVRAAIAAQRALGAHEWGETGELRVRMGLHTGAAEVRDGDYYGSSLNRAARLMAVAHGGQVVCSRATADLARDSLAEGVVLTDLGEHRLRDLSRPEQVFQVHTPDLTAMFAPLRSIDSFPGNLPLQVSSFIGRERELARTVEALRESRVVTLTGVGGVGKTRLAYQVAGQVLPRYREGAWLVELAPVRDPDGVVDVFAAVFGVTPPPGLTVEQSLVEFFRTKQLLLVVDNCEHVLEAVADLVEQIELACGGISVLATSREGLALDGERLLPVPSLPGPPRDGDREAAARSDAVQLFVERARASDPDFALSDANLDAVAQVCRRLDGVPLAIELAAARITTMNPAELAGALDRRLDVLSGGRRRAVKRHQTLRATIDWSYELLDDAQRRLLARLSVFAGGCTRDAAEAVCSDEPLASRAVFELLASLVSQSLVVAERDGPETRYRLLETIREYAEERLAEHDEVEVLRDRHAAYYAEFVERCVEHVFGPEQLVWANRLSAERDNLLAAWSWAIDSGDVDTAFRIASLNGAGTQIGYELALPTEALLTLRDAAEHPDYPLILLQATVSILRRGEDDRVELLCEQALAADARRAPRDPRVEYWASYICGSTAFQRADLAAARDFFELAVAVARVTGIHAGGAFALAYAANMRTLLGDAPGANALAAESVAAARAAGMPTAIAVSLIARGTAIAATDPEEARAYLEESLRLSGDLGYEQFGELISAAYLASLLRDRRATLELAGRVIRHAQWMENRGTLSQMFPLAGRALRRSRPEASAAMLATASAINEGAGGTTIDVDEVSRVALAAIAEALADPEFG